MVRSIIRQRTGTCSGSPQGSAVPSGTCSGSPQGSERVPGKKRYIAVDVETTGLSPLKGDRVIEIGAVALEGGELVTEFSSLIKVPRAIPTIASRIHGITDGMLLGQPPPEEVFPALASFIRDSVLVAHNAPFDMGFIRHEFGRLKLNLPNRHICTLEMSRMHLPHLRNHKLETVYRHLIGTNGDTLHSGTCSGSSTTGDMFRKPERIGSTVGDMFRKPEGIGTCPRNNERQTHRALDDARMVANIWLAMEGR